MALRALNLPVLTRDEIDRCSDYVKERAASQFINLYNIVKDRRNFPFKWGDEIEYTLVKFDDENKKVQVSCRAEELVPQLQAIENENGNLGIAHWCQEITKFQIESTPGKPYEGFLECFDKIEDNMTARRKQILKFFEKGENLLSISFPSLGVHGFADPPMKPNSSLDGCKNSIFMSDDVMFSGYENIVRNIQERRRKKIVIHVPVFKDVNTPSPYIDDISSYGKGEVKPDHIYMDHLAQGMGCCCLQVTFQAPNLEEARWLNDQLTSLTPIVLALSASTPIFRSTLADVDSRWDVLSGAVDDRSPKEWVMNSSLRYGASECYVSPSSSAYNDLPVLYDDKIFKKLLQNGIDSSMAKYVANILHRDPLQLVHGRIELDDEKQFTHAEMMMISVWHNIRLKIPPSGDPKTGWRVEFRPTEIQLTDYENAAFTCFLVLCTRVITAFRLNTLIPISMVAENMKRAQKRDSVLNQKFYFRKEISRNSAYKVDELTVNEIINGTSSGFVGFIPLIYRYLDTVKMESNTRHRIMSYLTFISKRASGKVCTLARWIRDFVEAHPSYKKDSNVPNDTIYDMLKLMNDISSGKKYCKKLLGKLDSDPFNFNDDVPNAA